MYRISNSIIMRGVVAALFLVTAASASVIGNLVIGTDGNITVTLTSATFGPDPTSVPPGFQAAVAMGTNLTFTGGPLAVGEGVGIASPLTAASVPENDFLSFAAHPNLIYSLATLGPGSANTNCAAVTMVGQSCSVFAGSPIVLTWQSATSSSASFAVTGKASDTGLGGVATGSNYSGLFSEPLVNLLPNGMLPTPANIQAYFCPSGTCTAADFASGRSVSSAFAGNFFATTVPEPETTALVLGGLLVLLGKVGMRRLNRSR
jgi:hypothetical protein